MSETPARIEWDDDGHVWMTGFDGKRARARLPKLTETTYTTPGAWRVSWDESGTVTTSFDPDGVTEVHVGTTRQFYKLWKAATLADMEARGIDTSEFG